MKKITFYFGSFNPIHNGHVGLANYLVNNNLSDEVYFVVSPRNPLKNEQELIDENLRIEMVRLATGSDSRLQASDIEFDMPKPSYTIDTLKKLQQNFSDTRLSLLIGSDNALIFDQWKNYQMILQMVDILVYPRKNFDFQQVKEHFEQMTYLPNAPYFQISSTEIRNEIKKNRFGLAKKWLNPKVLFFIKSKKIY
ncbi:MAG: nicotinate (nicotinamide) nucleotide adenylyltransferase [Paludibacter sp.]|nr:nicotinate (nicotinamide) nucleotide adenylyltransferase [Paludibacter sp.]